MINILTENGRVRYGIEDKFGSPTVIFEGKKNMQRILRRSLYLRGNFVIFYFFVFLWAMNFDPLPQSTVLNKAYKTLEKYLL